MKGLLFEVAAVSEKKTDTKFDGTVSCGRTALRTTVELWVNLARDLSETWFRIPMSHAFIFFFVVV